jgi:hypothetical protein
LVGKPEGHHSENAGEGGRIILIWILGKLGYGVWIRFMWLGIGTDDRLVNRAVGFG